LRAQHGAGPGTTVLLNVAMFRPEKNQRELLEIAVGLPASTDWQLWLAGDGPARAACEARAKELGPLADRVRFLGFHANPAPLYAAADVAVHASWSEALSNFLIEAQAHGLPAVAATAQGIRECFLPGETGWEIPRGDHAAFRAALTRLMADPPAERARRSAAAREFARGRFDPARQVDAYLQLFARLAASAKS
jgi:glycosyltransferase involved in cell wall biosynthesis